MHLLFILVALWGVVLVTPTIADSSVNQYPDTPVIGQTLPSQMSRVVSGRYATNRISEDERWSDAFFSDGVDRDVDLIAVDSRNGIYVSNRYGAITTAGRTLAAGIAYWDGENWASVGNGISTTGRIGALAVDAQDNLYVGGHAITANDAISATNILKWNGSNWSALGSGTNGEVCALATDQQGNLYAGGGFTITGDIPARHVAKWDGSAWSPLGAGVDAFVEALAAHPSGTLYTVSNDYSHSRYTLTRWDGQEWVLVDQGDGLIKTLALDQAGNLYAGGMFLLSAPFDGCCVGKWDGTIWSKVGNGVSDWVYGLALDKQGNLYVRGSFQAAGGVKSRGIARWDGSTWTGLGSGTNGSVGAIAADSLGRVYVGGTFYVAGDETANHIAIWDGDRWSALGEHGNGLWQDWTTLRLAADGIGNIYLSGTGVNTVAGVTITRIAQWDGATWTAIGNDINDDVSALVTDAQNHLYIGGNFTQIGQLNVSHVARWDRSNWTALGGGLPFRVSALAIGKHGTLIAGGTSYLNQNIAEWDDNRWKFLGTGLPTTQVNALAIDCNGTVYAGGSAMTLGLPVNLARWDGSSWSTIPAPSQIFGLAIGRDCNLYISGLFTHIAGTAGDYIARWDGARWWDLEGGTNGYVASLGFGSAGSLFAAGSFTMAGGVSANRIARWDGQHWIALGSGLSGRYPVGAQKLVLDSHGNLFIGGNFTVAGGKPSRYLAQWMAPVLSAQQWLPIIVRP
jgi:hypothetical protein